MSLPKAKLSLRAYKGHLTRNAVTCENLISQGVTDRTVIDTSVKNLESRWTGYDEAYRCVENILLESTSPNIETEIEELQDDYYKLQTNYLQIIAQLRSLIKPREGDTSTSRQNTTAVKPKLPSIQLPTFSGNIIEYEAFIDQFEAQVGSRSDLEDVTKLQYLKTQLKGRALDLIKGFTSISANYQNALDILKETYGDDEKIKHCLLQSMINMEQPKHNKSDLETFRISMLNLTRSLFNKHDYSASEWIVSSIIQHKLPTQTIRQLYLKYEKNYFNLNEINDGLRDLISHMEVESKQKSPSTKNDNPVKESHIGSYFHTESQNKSTACKFCGRSHKDSQCTKYLTGNDRIQRLKELKLCLRCMGTHYTKTCTVKLQSCRKCHKGPHHTTLCTTYDRKKQTGSVQTSTPNNDSQQSTDTNSSSQPSNVGHINTTTVAATTKPTGVALATAIAKLEQNGEKIRLFFDPGSQRTFITKALVNRVGMTVKSKSTMTITGFMGQPTTNEYDIVKPVIQMGNRKKRLTAVVIDELPQTIVTIGLTDVVNKLINKGIHLADPIIKDDKVGPIDILVGCDHYYDFISINSIVEDGIHLLKSPAGYIVTGNIPCLYNKASTITSSDTVQESVIVMKITSSIEPLTDLQTQSDIPPVHKLWDLDIIGIDPTQSSPDDQTSYKEYLNTVKYEDNQYWVKLPWKVNKPDLPTNYRKACGQMYSLIKELKRKGLIQKYSDVIQEQVELEFIEEVPTAKPTDNSHYLPHHGVIKDSSTTPLRIVYNCSSKAQPQEPSLNECLMTGPSLTRKLGDVLLKFRTNRYAYTADISKAFLRIGLQEKDRDFTRFLWLTDPHNLESPIKTYRFKSVLFGATSSPFLLQATIDYHLNHSNSPIKELLTSNFYVDNFQGATNEQELLLNIYNEANKEMKLANMPLRQWTTNNTYLQDQIKTDFPDYDIPVQTSILGLEWNTESDTLRLKPLKTPHAENKTLTKRSLLANVSRVYDPLGIFSPITIRGKILIQEAWKQKISWDEPLPQTYEEQWSELKHEYNLIPNMEIPRSVVNEDSVCQLHMFCDASMRAYGAVAYIVVGDQSFMLTSKARVTPLKSRTIPQLELTALLIGTKLSKYIRDTLVHINITETYLWTDSEITLQWVRNNNCKMPYVQNRVTEIYDLQNSCTFMHVNTKSNPADLLSRGVTVKQLDNNLLWFNGPEWLTNREQWPEQKDNVTSINYTYNDTEENIVRTQQLVDPQRFSSLDKLLRVTNLVFKFIKIIYTKKNWNKELKETSPMMYWIRLSQIEVYQNEMALLSRYDPKNTTELSKRTLLHNTCELSKKTLTKPKPELSKKTLRHNKLINQLGLYLDDSGIIRCKGRIQNSTLRFSSKHPILLPKKHWFSHLIIKKSHLSTLHGGVGDTLVDIRKTFWIPKVRQAIKSIIKKCTTCIRYDARPVTYPNPPPLPEQRVQETRPFQVVGIDYTGAINIRSPEMSKDSEPTKVYICLFTCANTRAVHLELAMDMTTSTFLRLFRRFIARRSCPRVVITDNGSNFKKGEVIVREFFKQDEVKMYFEEKKCDWHFIAPRAPWQGGFYERMIGVVKKCLRKVLHNKRVSIDELRTLLVEIEARVNNRPLSYVNEGIDEPEALTPNHLIHGHLIETIPPVVHNDYNMDPDYLSSLGTNKKELMNRFNHLNKVLKSWNNIWRQDYLLALRERFYGNKFNETKCKLQVGDIVIINNEDFNRSTWPLGKIFSLIPDKYGDVRLVKVLSKGKESLRTVDKLIPLEISHSENSAQDKDAVNCNSRSRRKAALQARKKWQCTGVED